MATKFDGKTKDGIAYTVLRDKNGKPRKAANGRELRSYTWRYRDAFGKSRQITGRNLDQVRAKRDEIRDSLNKGTYVDPRHGRVLIEEYCARWLELNKPFMDHNTWSTHEKRIRLHIVPQMGHLRAYQIDADVIEGFQAYLADGRSMVTARTYYTTFNKIISDMVNRDILTSDPRKGVRKIKTAWLKKKTPYSPQEIAALENAAEGELRRLITIKRGTGLRISELLALDESQIDWTPGAEMLHADRQVGRDAEGATIIKDPKSAKSNRVIPLAAWVVNALKEQMTANPTRSQAMTWVHRDNSVHDVTTRLIFHDGEGTPRPYFEIRNEWNAVVKIAGVTPKGEEGTGLHRLRHTYAGDLIQQGVDIYMVSCLMGHSTVRVTEQYYAHLRKETLETARAALNALNTPRPTLTIAPAA